MECVPGCWTNSCIPLPKKMGHGQLLPSDDTAPELGPQMVLCQMAQEHSLSPPGEPTPGGEGCLQSSTQMATTGGHSEFEASLGCTARPHCKIRREEGREGGAGNEPPSGPPNKRGAAVGHFHRHGEGRPKINQSHSLRTPKGLHAVMTIVAVPPPVLTSASDPLATKDVRGPILLPILKVQCEVRAQMLETVMTNQENLTAATQALAFGKHTTHGTVLH